MPSDRAKRHELTLRPLNGDSVTGAKDASGQNDRHDAGLADFGAIRGSADTGLHQTRMQSVQLHAGVAQSGYLDDGSRSEVQPRPQGKPQQIDAAGGHVFAHLARSHRDPCGSKLGEEFGVEEMHLAEIRSGGILADAIAMPHRYAGVRVAFDTEACQQANLGQNGL